MSTNPTAKTQRKDYSLTGPNGALAIERGLAEARWYASPILRAQMRELLRRRDGPAIRDTLLWFGLLLGSGIAGYRLRRTPWAIIPFAIYSVIYGSTSDSRWHESGHGTAFKTGWMNDVLYEIASFMVGRESTVWRWSHTRHHSDTIIVGRDAEIGTKRPPRLVREVLFGFVGFSRMYGYFQTLAKHVAGRLTPAERTFVPEAETRKVILRARIYAMIYLGVLGLAAYRRSILPLLYVGLPNLYGSWLMVVYGLTQHAGLAEDVLDHRLNTRTVYMNPLNRYLYWNMGYHIEHHMFPLVPYHALPRLHELMKADCPPAYNGLLDAYREIIPTLVRQSKDATWFYKRDLPTPEAVAPAAESARDADPVAPAIISVAPPVDGWVEVCASSRLQAEDAVRFDHAGQTYAVYRTADGKLYATGGICTHGNAQLAGGLVLGKQIECPKHNGRFDLRDGSPQRPPVCVGLKTYDVAERDGRIMLDVRSAHGAGVTQAPPSYTFRVVSNENVATFIKELVLEPAAGSSPAAGSLTLAYRPGDYLQFEIPAYPERSLREISVPSRYAAAWEATGAFDLVAANPTACRRSYSFATNPALDRQLRFNVRLATPPLALPPASSPTPLPGAQPIGTQPLAAQPFAAQPVAAQLRTAQLRAAGVGSTYLFGLRPGDLVSASGPFGTFHIRPGEREMVYLGGGSGMAPLRAHLSHLFETERTARRVSYWYGARSLSELYYADYFADLARANPNFTFHVALSDPRPADRWTSHTGYIHEVLQRAYLAAHPDPAQVDYYLCGPLPMVRAATRLLSALGVPPAQILSDEF